MVLTDQWLVIYSGGLACSTAFLANERFVFAEIAFEPSDERVALKCEYVGGDTVKKPPVVADDHCTPCKIFKAAFQSS